MAKTFSSPARGSAVGAPADKREARINGAISEILLLEESGALITDIEIKRRYKSLLPDLLDELRTARAIRAAQAAARNASPPAPSAPDIQNDATLLRQSLKAGLDGLELLEQLDTGGQGVIFKAMETDSKRLVAVKVLRDGSLSPRRHRERFAHEIEIIGRLHHPNIVALYRSGICGEHQYFVMEYVDGLPIDDYVVFHNPAVQDAVRLFEKVCRAVSSAHQRGVVHRDLKPGNILVDLDGEPHVLDFGLAKDIDLIQISPERSRLSVTGQIFGTLPYLSPEQAAGVRQDVDVRSDVYSLGVILFHLLTGEMPYPVEGTLDKVRENILTHPTASPRAVVAPIKPEMRCTRGEISDDLERVILRALAKETDRRYQSVDAFADDLIRYLLGHAVTAKSDSRWYVFRKAVARHRLAVGFSLAFVLLLAAALTGVTIMWRYTAHIARVAQVNLEMGSYSRIGSVARDSGRMAEALVMFEKAAELGRATSTTDDAFQMSNFSVNYQLADLHHNSGRADLARPFSESAVRIAESSCTANPDNLEWQRILACSYLIRARDESSAGRSAGALSALDHAVAIRRQLVVRNPDNDGLRSELAQAIAIQGRYLREAGRDEEAIAKYEAAYAVFLQLVERAPTDPHRWLDVAMTENRFAAWHLNHETDPGNVAGAEWLARAKRNLDKLSKFPGALNRAGEIARLRAAIDRNVNLIQKRVSHANDDPGDDLASAPEFEASTGIMTPSGVAGRSSLHPTSGPAAAPSLQP